MNNYQFDLGAAPKSPRKRGRVWKIAGVILGLVLVAGLLVYSGGMENVLKFLGVGASGIYEITLTSNRHWIADTSAAPFLLEGSEPVMDGASVFDQFSGTPQDISLDEGNKGFVMAVFSSPQDPAKETYLQHSYTSAIIDLTLAEPLLSAIQVSDFIPAESAISYSYRTAASGSAILAAPWQVVEPTVINTAADEVRARTAIIEEVIERYAQIKFTFDNVDPMRRSAVYAVSFQYKDDGEESAGTGTAEEISDGNESEREISLHYAEVNAPANADIDVLSSSLDNKVVYAEKQIDLSERLSYTFRTALSPGAYALVVSGPTTETKIIPFMVNTGNSVQVELGSFESATEGSTYDLNGDGVVNSIDLQLLLGKFTP